MSEFSFDKDRLLGILQQMISIESVNPRLSDRGSGELELSGYIGQLMQSWGLLIQHQSMGMGRYNVLGILPSPGTGKSLLLNGHMDTVSIEGMNIPAFVADYKEGKVYGRGAHDMKGGLAAQLMAMKTIAESGVKLKGDVILACVSDEEYASIGTEELVKKYKTDAAIVCEPTDLNITIAHKGFAWTDIEIFGKAAHGSLPDKGIDAIVKAGKVLTELENLETNVFPNTQHPLLGRPSIHASKIKGGKEISTYPDYCKLEVERRTLPSENKETVEEETRQLIDRIKKTDPDFHAKYDVRFYRPGLEVDKNQDIVQCLDRSYQSVLNKKPSYNGLNYWMDSAILANAGIPTVIFGPAGEGAHAAVEYVDFDSVVTTTEVLIKTILEFCS